MPALLPAPNLFSLDVWFIPDLAYFVPCSFSWLCPFSVLCIYLRVWVFWFGLHVQYLVFGKSFLLILWIFCNCCLVNFWSTHPILLWKPMSSRLLASRGWPAPCSRKWPPRTAQDCRIMAGEIPMETWTSSWALSAMCQIHFPASPWRCVAFSCHLRLFTVQLECLKCFALQNNFVDSVFWGRRMQNFTGNLLLF